MIMDTFVKVLNSNQEICADESFVVTMGFLKKATKAGGGKHGVWWPKKNFFLNFNSQTLSFCEVA